ncbi:phosphoribosyltransferase family protein [Fluviicola sp.]|jgi:pyrimidine operon attenuation protein/uracil phosphoribosyltransferase|uniref:phosphoribosyltransferase family protein n=1 Tax=Fluviicola sp. TaxID=1917219 RepID=UPI00281C7805|nr:phosphoribosyltransferase family protein [Fluviicola sp.]MDR0803304.1 phosphoribosyltransferase [Fluviicola sp.]
MKLVLNQHQIEQKITRLAHEILENTYGITELFIGGITGNGETFAQQICEILQKNSSQKINYFKIELDKDHPLDQAITCSIDPDQFSGKTVILVDDVINSGTTMQYGVLKILEKPVKSVKTVALVDRMHRKYPIKCNFVGMTLSTTLGERVEVMPSNGALEAFLV